MADTQTAAAPAGGHTVARLGLGDSATMTVQVDRTVEEVDRKSHQIELGEEITLDAGEILDGDASKGQWHSTGSAAIASTPLKNSVTLTIVGSSIGRSLLSYRPAGSQQAAAFDVEVVAKKDTKPAPGVFATSEQFNGLVPMDERQDEPSEKTPYGMDQNSKPVMPHPSMEAGDASAIARASKDAKPLPSDEKPAAKAAKDARENATDAREDKTKAAGKKATTKKAASKKASK